MRVHTAVLRKVLETLGEWGVPTSAEVIVHVGDKDWDGEANEVPAIEEEKHEV